MDLRRGPKLKGPVSEKDWNQFDQLCGMQCTLAEIAAWFDCDPDTVQARVQEKYKEKFSVVFRQKRKKGHVSLRRAQMQKALAGDSVMLIFLGKKYLGQGEIIDWMNRFDDD